MREGKAKKHSQGKQDDARMKGHHDPAQWAEQKNKRNIFQNYTSSSTWGHHPDFWKGSSKSKNNVHLVWPISPPPVEGCFLALSPRLVHAMTAALQLT